MATHVMNQGHHTKAALVSTNNQVMNDDYDLMGMMPFRSPSSGEKPEEPRCIPAVGSKIFWIGYRPFSFSRTPMQASNITRHVIRVSTLGWSIKPLWDFVQICHEYKVDTFKQTMTANFYCHGGLRGDWDPVTKAVRKLDTMDIDDDVKADLINDAEAYYREDSKKLFADCGIPYRCGYLFYGPPGTGKTSFSAALAGHLKCDLYIINLTDDQMSDNRLRSAFIGLPEKCVVVLEDVDCAGIGRAVRSRVGLTLSGLLNAIDGNASQEGRLLVMTTNNADKLDGALTRPGRVDKKVYFGNISATSARRMFERLIGRAAIAAGTLTRSEIEKKALSFARRLPPNKFTPAQAQSFLQNCRGDADKALAEIGTIMEETISANPMRAPSRAESMRSDYSPDSSDADLENGL